MSGISKEKLLEIRAELAAKLQKLTAAMQTPESKQGVKDFFAYWAGSSSKPIEILASDRRQVILYWHERGILGDEEAGERYIETGELQGGKSSADGLAKHFARYRVELSK